jgi:hypothetical protein
VRAGAFQEHVKLLLERSSSLRGPQAKVACPGEPEIADVSDHRGVSTQRARNLAGEEADRAGAGDQNPVASGDGALAGSPDPNRNRFGHRRLLSRQPRRAEWAKAASVATQWLIDPFTGGVAKKTTCGHRL